MDVKLFQQSLMNHMRKDDSHFKHPLQVCQNRKLGAKIISGVSSELVELFGASESDMVTREAT